MAAWFYKATNTKLDSHGTLILTNRGFLCRSAYTRAPAWVPNVRKVAFGDVINFYFIGRNPHPLGAFEVIRRDDFTITKPVPARDNFEGPVDGCALYAVIDPAFIAELDPEGRYKLDPKLERFTGWLIRKVGPAAKAPAKFLSEEPTLVPA
jgi:hypothetical protein